MKRLNSLKVKKEFSLLFSRGKKIDSMLFRIIARRTSLLSCRIAVVVSKTISKKAVVRNAIRRHIREWLRKYILSLNMQSFDIAFVVKKEVITHSKKFLYEELEREIKKI